MGKVVIVACTNVGRSMIESIMNSDKLKTIALEGVINLKPEIAVDKSNYDSYMDLFKKYSINHYYCDNINEQQSVEFIKKCEPDIIIQSGWSQKFNEEVLNIPKYACIGEHPAPLPKGRGAACINWAIITGEHKWGDTFFNMEMNYDTGMIYSQENFNIEVYDDVKTVYDKVAEVAVKAIEKNLTNWAEGKLNGIKQNDSESTHYPRRRPSDGLFSFNEKDAMSVYNYIRGQARPYPGAFFMYNTEGVCKKVYIWKCRIGINQREEEVAAYCGDGKCVFLQRVQEEGKPEMWAKDYFKVNSIGGETND